MSSSQQGHHRQKYKTGGADSSELRRRREEEGVQLRKQKRENEIYKRRNIGPVVSEALDDNDLDATVSSTTEGLEPTFATGNAMATATLPSPSAGTVITQDMVQAL